MVTQVTKTTRKQQLNTLTELDDFLVRVKAEAKELCDTLDNAELGDISDDLYEVVKKVRKLMQQSDGVTRKILSQYEEKLEAEEDEREECVGSCGTLLYPQNLCHN